MATRKRILSLHKACCDHARHLLEAAELLLQDRKKANIAFHLAVIALEEIGKAALLLSAHTAPSSSQDFAQKGIQDHEFKLTWAIWGTLVGVGKMKVQDIGEARDIARSIHEDRLRSMYVDSLHPTPRKAVTIGQVRNVLSFAKSRLALEATPKTLKKNPDYDWFVSAVADRRLHNVVFSKPSIEKLNELQGDSRAWVKWLQDEVGRTAAEEKEHFERELSRLEPKGDDRKKEKWKVTVRLVSSSHAIRPRALRVWNDRVKHIQLSATGKKNDLFFDLTLPASIHVSRVGEAAGDLSRELVIAINIASLGFFWWGLLSNGKFYERIQDLEAASHISLEIGKESDAPIEWGSRTFDEADVHRLIKTYLLISLSKRNKARSEVFSSYLGGLTFFAKTDVHYNFGKTACDLFNKALWQAMICFGDWDGQDQSRYGVFTKILEPFIPSPDIQQYYALATEKRESAPVPGEAIAKCKLAFDLYMLAILEREFPRLGEGLGSS